MDEDGKNRKNPFDMDNIREQQLNQNKINQPEDHFPSSTNNSTNNHHNKIDDIMNSTVEDILQNKLGLNIGSSGPNNKHRRSVEENQIVNPTQNQSQEQPYIFGHDSEENPKKGLSKFEKIAGLATVLFAGKYVVDAFTKKNNNSEDNSGGNNGNSQQKDSGFISKIVGLIGLIIIGIICVVFGWLILGQSLHQFEGTKFEEDYYDISKRIVNPYQNEDGTTPTPTPTLDIIESFKKRSVELRIAPYKKLDDSTILVKISDDSFVKSSRQSTKNVGYVRTVIARLEDNSIESIIIGNQLADKCTDLQLLSSKGAKEGETFVCGKPTIIQNSEVFNKDTYLSLVNSTVTQAKGFWGKIFGKSEDKSEDKSVNKQATTEKIPITPTTPTPTDPDSGEISDEERLQLELELQERANKEKHEQSFGKYKPNTEVVEETWENIKEKARETKDKIGQTIGD